jgi:hypothetical protein
MSSAACNAPNRWHRPCCSAAAVATLGLLFVVAAIQAQEGPLDTIRDDVRQGRPSLPSPAEKPGADRPTSSSSDPDPWLDGMDGQTLLALPFAAVIAATSPIWVPQGLLEDNFPAPGYFLRYPYDHSPEYIKMYEGCPRTRSCAGRLDLEYIDDFHDLQSFGGHLFLETSSRFGLDTSFSRISDRPRYGRRDELNLGDCNLVYRFAQSNWAECHAGLGTNWLDDSRGTELGFNFTYSADVFPKKPWVLCAAIDWGTLGRAQLFRFRTTAGVAIRHVELYTGYEYTDIERTQWNGLVGGVRLWF